jgi:hypothetical protein
MGIIPRRLDFHDAIYAKASLQFVTKRYQRLVAYAQKYRANADPEVSQ